jgi:DHA1 family bicyclomycin/chloramphenicol resistance-like MFS transporter
MTGEKQGRQGSFEVIDIAGKQQITTVKLVLILGALTAFNSMSIDMYLPGFPQMARDLGVPLGTVQLSISAFLYGSAIGQLLYGPVADRWGRKRPLLFGLALYIISTVGCALVRSGEGLLFWRVVMALGGGASIVISRAVVRDLYDTAEAARMFSLLMLVMGAAPILAPFFGGQLLLFIGWRGIFAFLGLFGFLSFYGAVVWLPESLPKEKRIQHRFRHMMTGYGRLFKNRRYLYYAIALGAVAGFNFSYIAGAPQLFIELHGVSPQHFGIIFGLNAGGLIGASQLNRKLLRHYPAEQILLAASIMNLVGAILLAAAAVSGFGGLATQMILLFACLCTTGLLYPNVTALALAPFATVAGTASALLGTIQYTLGATAGAFVGMFHNGTGLPMVITMACCAFVGTVAVTCAHRLINSEKKPPACYDSEAEAEA